MDIAQEKKGGSDKQWIEKIREGDECAFEQLFFEYFYDLCAYALQITKSEEQAKDIVQEVFFKLWKRRQDWEIHTSLKAYLFQSVRNEALNQLDRTQHREEVREEFTWHQKSRMAKQSGSKSEVTPKLLEQIWAIVWEMPQRRQSVFVLHRKHGLSYKEIAQVLEISRKTVENHMGLALDDIRERINMDLY